MLWWGRLWQSRKGLPGISISAEYLSHWYCLILHLKEQWISDSADCNQGLSPSLVLFQVPSQPLPTFACHLKILPRQRFSRVTLSLLTNLFQKKIWTPTMCKFWAFRTKISNSCSQSFICTCAGTHGFISMVGGREMSPQVYKVEDGKSHQRSKKKMLKLFKRRVRLHQVWGKRRD